MLAASLAFDSPAYLILLGLIPALWWWGYRSLTCLGPRRRWAALLLRSLVLAALVVALADVQFRRENDKLAVVYLLDQSLSIPAEVRREMMAYVSESVDAHLRADRGDRFAVIVFGRNAGIEVPLVETKLALHPRIETLVDPEYTDLETAIQRAQAILPPDAARRLVLVTDGAQNLGNAYAKARAAADAGIGLDVVPIYSRQGSDVAVEKIDAPASARKDQPFQLRVVLDHRVSSGSATSVDGAVRIVRSAGGEQQTVAEEPVSLAPGKRVLTIAETLELADFYTYEARFIPAAAGADGSAQNNVATAFTHVRGRGQVLLIENDDAPGQFDPLIRCVRDDGLQVEVRTTADLFNSLADLQRYDCVVLGNVPRSSVDDADSVAHFSDSQIDALVRNTSELGSGLVMIGGPDAYGAGGWAGTKLEEAMPVDFQIKSAKVTPVGALALVIDRSGSMQGEKLAMSRAAAIAAVKALGPRDFVSVTAFDEGPLKVVPLQRVGDAQRVAKRVASIGSAGGTNMFPAMEEGFRQLMQAEASVKHMIVLTDGQTPDAQFGQLVRKMAAAKVTVTSVAVGSDANVPLLQRIASAGRGKFYLVRNPRALPRIFMREVRRVARPLVYEPPTPVTPQFVASHEILRGLDHGVPPISGFVLTDVKQNPLVQVLLRSPVPAAEKNATVLAAWNYGAGKTVALTTDAGRRWADSWVAWDGYDKFFSQIVRWAMRPTEDGGNYTIAAAARNGRAEVTITAIDAAGELLNGQSFAARVVTPGIENDGGDALPIAVEQVAPGRYVGSFPAARAGSYMIVVKPGLGTAPLVAGLSVGYSAEYQGTEVNAPLLRSLAQLRAGGNGPAGSYDQQGLAESPAATDKAGERLDPFRGGLPPAVSTQAVWPWVVVAGSVLFWSDVFVRRVQLETIWIRLQLARVGNLVLRRRPADPIPVTIERLRRRKQEIADAVAARRSALAPDIHAAEHAAAASTVHDDLEGRCGEQPAASVPPADDVSANADDDGSYTARLLRAKRKVWD